LLRFAFPSDDVVRPLQLVIADVLGPQNPKLTGDPGAPGTLGSVELVGNGGVSSPLPVTVAVSVTLAPGETVASDLVVVIDAEHSGNVPKSKSDSVAVIDCDERLSVMKLEKHWFASLRFVMSTPPSKNVPAPN
jgi:hypothetical protein